MTAAEYHATIKAKEAELVTLCKDIEILKSHNAKVVKLLDRLGTWIEDEAGAELPFVTDEELELYRSVVS